MEAHAERSNGKVDCADPACTPTAVCAPASDVTGAVVNAADSCPDGFKKSETPIFQGLNDPGCAGCSCSAAPTQCTGHVYYYMTTTAHRRRLAAAGGNCDNVWVKLGHDWSCGTIDGMLHDGQKSCSISTYSPPAIMSGTPTDPTCTSSAAESGSVTASGALDLCCSGGSGVVSLDTP